MEEQITDYDEFFEGDPKLAKEELGRGLLEVKSKKNTFKKYPCTRNLTISDMIGEEKWEDRAKFYFLPFLINCYKFTKS